MGVCLLLGWSVALPLLSLQICSKRVVIFFLILFKEMHFCKIKIRQLRQDTNTPFQLVLLLVFLLHAIRLHLCRACQLQRLHQPIKSGFMITSVYKKDKTCPISGEQHQDKAGTPCNGKIVLQCFNLSIYIARYATTNNNIKQCSNKTHRSIEAKSIELIEVSPCNHEVCEHLDVVMILETILNMTQELKDVKPV